MAKCEDWPCCGHPRGHCPTIKNGEEIFYCLDCWATLPPRSPSSLCKDCLREGIDRAMEMGD